MKTTSTVDISHIRQKNVMQINRNIKQIKNKKIKKIEEPKIFFCKGINKEI